MPRLTPEEMEEARKDIEDYDKMKKENEEDTGTGIIQGTPFCDCGALMVCLDGVELICPVCEKKE